MSKCICRLMQAGVSTFSNAGEGGEWKDSCCERMDVTADSVHYVLQKKLTFKLLFFAGAHVYLYTSLHSSQYLCAFGRFYSDVSFRLQVLDPDVKDILFCFLLSR
jgi:hypothetical protein